jgi:hypothetical protein
MTFFFIDLTLNQVQLKRQSFAIFVIYVLSVNEDSAKYEKRQKYLQHTSLCINLFLVIDQNISIVDCSYIYTLAADQYQYFELPWINMIFS